jgi:hypothetical protein
VLESIVNEISPLQTRIMEFIDTWVRTIKTPVPQREIILQLKDEGVKDYTTENALRVLKRKGYIRNEITVSNRVRYVQIRGILR